ncbi:MAG: YcgN family cysteine cluster protein [Anaerovoracaceae bacterium]
MKPGVSSEGVVAGETLGSFWETIPLEQMTPDQWESLCDRCGRCCLYKVEKAGEGRVFYTAVACRLLDCEGCLCKDYEVRKNVIHRCLLITPSNLETIHGLLPATCAYRRIFEGKNLACWHPLISGSPDTVHEAGISVRSMAVSEALVHPDDLEYLLKGEGSSLFLFEDKHY